MATLKVLIVEAEPDIRDLLAFRLERDGYQVAKARSGADALRQAETSPPDLVLLDLMLPEMDGLDRGLPPAPPEPRHAGHPDRHADRGDDVDRAGLAGAPCILLM